MEKVLVSLFIPAIGKSFDVFIPKFLQIRIVCELLGTAIMELSNEEYISSGQELLCSVEKQQILSFDHTLEDYEVQIGEMLILC